MKRHLSSVVSGTENIGSYLELMLWTVVGFWLQTLSVLFSGFEH